MLRLLLCFVVFTSAVFAAPPVQPGQRILFLGDSITQGSQYVSFIDAGIIADQPGVKYDVLCAGLSSETVSGLSEPGHAGGKFPRPDLHERLDRALAKTKPDLVLACYGMNDGIYMPLSEERFKAFREGMIKLHDKAIAAGAKIIHLTPPVFDPLPIAAKVDDSGEPGKTFRNYNDVLGRYAEWLIEQRKNGWEVIDLHGAMTAALAAERAKDPAFTFAKDGIHPNEAGHQVMAQPVLDAWGIKAKVSPELFKIVHQKTSVLRDAWLSEIGHKRPGVKAGLPVAEATAKAAELDAQARKLLSEK
jgi:lysophospholipase L1-like esterase